MSEQESRNEKSIHELIGTHFLVPSYQRGYRWQKVNVLDLLNDLYEFIHSKKAVYSLQPLVVSEDKIKGKELYHVVDGQQRLTTISILLGYLGLSQIDICYESRKEQQKNLRTNEDTNIDQYHVNRAYDAIKDWFEHHPDEEKGFKKLLQRGKKQVKFIWYCTKDDEVATFIRLNKDKISLTNAELIKAMLLKKGNFSGNSVLIQKSIAVEWNQIENTFNDDAFWRFIRPLEDKRETRIDFLFELIRDKNLLQYSPKESVGDDQYSTFRYFYSYFKAEKENAFQKIWEQVNKLYNIVLNWYNEIELYHYIGFLIIDNPKYIEELLDDWMTPGMTIETFKEILKGKINQVIKGCNNLAKQYNKCEAHPTEPDKTVCRPILLLFNIQRIIILNRNMSKRSETQIFNKFPFHLYKSEKWDVEHIASNTDNDFSQPEAQKEWLKTFLLDGSLSAESRSAIKEFINCDKPNKSSFDTIREKLEQRQDETLQKEEHLDDAEKNQIWNFCLLDSHTNRSYGNSIFPVKRRIIMGKEMGKMYKLDDNLQERTVPNVVAFVPYCTKDAFIKAYTANATSNREWSRTDAIAYRQEMYDCLKEEFNVTLK